MLLSLFTLPFYICWLLYIFPIRHIVSILRYRPVAKRLQKLATYWHPFTVLFDVTDGLFETHRLQVRLLDAPREPPTPSPPPSPTENDGQSLPIRPMYEHFEEPPPEYILLEERQQDTAIVAAHSADSGPFRHHLNFMFATYAIGATLVLLKEFSAYAETLLLIAGLTALTYHMDGIFRVAIVGLNHKYHSRPSYYCRRAIVTMVYAGAGYLIVGVYCAAHIQQDGGLRLQFMNDSERFLVDGSFKDVLVACCFVDVVAKLLTIGAKILMLFFAMLHCFPRMGRLMACLESAWQLIRAILPIFNWYCYFNSVAQSDQVTSSQSTILWALQSLFFALILYCYLACKFVQCVLLLRTLCISLVQLPEKTVRLGRPPNEDEMKEAGERCPICLDEFRWPRILHCKHIVCEVCLNTWNLKDARCPICRDLIIDRSCWRDGATSHLPHIF